MDKKKKGILLVILGASLWGGSSNSAEFLMIKNHFSWDTILYFRMLFTGAIFMGISLYRKLNAISLIKENWKNLLKFVVLGMYLMQIPFFKAIYSSNAATATVLQYTMPVILLIMYLVKEKRLPRKKEVFAVTLAFIGTILIATKGEGISLAVSEDTLFYGILSAFGMAFYTVYAAALLKKYNCVLVLGIGSLLNALMLKILNHPTLEGTILDIDAVIAFTILLVFGTLIAYYVYLESRVYISPSETGMLASVEPLSAYLFSILVMNNLFGTAELMGSLCIVAMVCILSRK